MVQQIYEIQNIAEAWRFFIWWIQILMNAKLYGLNTWQGPKLIIKISEENSTWKYDFWDSDLAERINLKDQDKF